MEMKPLIFQIHPFALFNSSPETLQCASNLLIPYKDLNNQTVNRQIIVVYKVEHVKTLTTHIYHFVTATSIIRNLTLDLKNNLIHFLKFNTWCFLYGSK